MNDIDEVHVSVAFTWDIPKAEWLARQWEHIAPVKIGGPALGDPGGEFEPGKYLRSGYTITSRGCVRQCSPCLAWAREGNIRELQIKSGWIIQDNNLLACSKAHILGVFSMLSQQPYPADFTGGFDSRLFKSWHANLLNKIRINQIFFAYDNPGDLEPLKRAGEILVNAGVGPNKRRCYVLMGLDGDTPEKAEVRCMEVWEAGFMPFAMYHRGPDEIIPQIPPKWKPFIRTWSRPAATRNKVGRIKS